LLPTDISRITNWKNIMNKKGQQINPMPINNTGGYDDSWNFFV
jgi:hypothetical protein